MGLSFCKFRFSQKTSEKAFYRYKIVNNDPYNQKSDYSGNSVRYYIRQKNPNNFVFAYGNEFILTYKPIEKMPELEKGISLELTDEAEIFPICEENLSLYEAWVEYFVHRQIVGYCNVNRGSYDYRVDNEYKVTLQTKPNRMNITILRIFKVNAEVQTDGTAYLSVDLKCEFETNQTVYDLIKDGKNVEGLEAKCIWQPYNKTYTITKVHNELINENIDGFNLWDYWENHAAWRLRGIDCSAPTVSAYDKSKKRDSLYIPQSLKPVITRDYIAANDSIFSKEVDRYTKLSMQKRLEEILKFLNCINYGKQYIELSPVPVEEFGFEQVDMSQNMPCLLIRNSQKIGFKEKYKAFLNGFYRVPDKPITAAFMSYDDDAEKCHKVVQAIWDYAKKEINGVSDVLLPLKFYGKSFHYKKGDRLSYEEIARQVKSIEKIDFVIAALPIEADEEDFYDSTASPYDSFKRAFADLGLPSQMVSVGMINDLGTNNVKYRLQNIILGILCKSGGIPWVLEEPMDGVDCFIGLDVGTQEKGIHYPACSVCLDGRGNLIGYYSTNVAQRGEIIDASSLETIFNRVLIAYKEANGEYPKHIVIHRDGFSNEEREWYIQYFSRRNIEFDIVEIRKFVRNRLIDENQISNEMNPCSGHGAIKGDEAFIVTTDVRPYLGSPRPLHLVHQYGKLPMDRLVRQVYILSEMHVGSMRMSRLPLTTLYADKICKHHDHVPHDILTDKLYFL